MTYKERGEVQTGVADLVKKSLKLLRKKGVKRVLDLGFGTGRHTVFLAENGFNVYGIDISKTGKKITEKKVREENLKNVHLKTADMKDIPFKNSFFDAIISVYVMEHNTLSSLTKTISEIMRVLKPGGVLFATLISTKDPRYGAGKKLEPNTFVNIYNTTRGDDYDVPHRFSDRKEIEKIFSKFTILKAVEKFGYSERRKAKIVHWELILEKS